MKRRGLGEGVLEEGDGRRGDGEGRSCCGSESDVGEVGVGDAARRGLRVPRMRFRTVSSLTTIQTDLTVLLRATTASTDVWLRSWDSRRQTVVTDDGMDDGRRPRSVRIETTSPDVWSRNGLVAVWSVACLCERGGVVFQSTTLNTNGKPLGKRPRESEVI